MTTPSALPRVRPAVGWRRFAQAARVDLPEVWWRFLLALVGLGLAFGAALFSTVSREAGNLWATLAFSTAALLLALLVGISSVPYLAKRVASGRIRDAFDYEVTRVGVLYVVALLLIGVAAMNTGNNLLYIIVAAMLAAILVSGVASAAVLRDLALDVQLPEHVFAGRKLIGKIVLRNRRRWMPSFSISVVPAIKNKSRQKWAWVPSTFSFPPKRPAQQQWLVLPDRRLRRIAVQAKLPAIFDGNAYFPYVPPRQELRAEMELCFNRRGRYQQESFGLSTRFPFAFLTKTLKVRLNQELLVFPSVEPTGELVDLLPRISGEFESFVRGKGHDLYRIREYLPEDSARHVDWKATAKSGVLKVREFSREDERRLRIVFDNPRKGAINHNAYERAVALAASLAWYFAAQNTKLSFYSQSFTSEQNPEDDLYRFLSLLAEVEQKEAPSLLNHLPKSDEFNVILTAEPKSSLSAGLLEHSYLISLNNE